MVLVSHDPCEAHALEASEHDDVEEFFDVAIRDIESHVVDYSTEMKVSRSCKSCCTYGVPM